MLLASPRTLCNNPSPHFSRSLRMARRRANGILTTWSSIRKMSSSSTKHLFAVFAPDYTDPGILEHRLSVREKHLKGVDRMVSANIMKFGGALLAPELIDESGRKKMAGSLIFYEAESIEEVRNLVESDIYYTSGVWDKEKVVVLPFVPAIPWPST